MSEMIQFGYDYICKKNIEADQELYIRLYSPSILDTKMLDRQGSQC